MNNVIDYLEFFFSGPDQLTSIGATFAVWFGLSLIGSVVSGPQGLRVAAPFYGWAVVTILFTLGGVFTPLSFTTIAIVIGLLALGSAIYLLRKNQPLVDSCFPKLAVLTLPLWLMTSGMVASQWDEFSHWLPSSLFLLNQNGFPDAANPVTGGSYPAYPYGWPLLIYLTGKLAGEFVENSGALLNLIALLTFGLVLLEVAHKGIGKAGNHRFKGWMMIAVAGLLVTAFNPTFVQKLVLTAYSETSTSITIGLAGILSWMMLDKLSEGDGKAATHLAWQTALALVVHINIRQANLVLFVILVFSILVIGVRDPKIGIKQLINKAILISAPPLLVYVTWRFHVAQNLSGAEFIILPFEEWLIELIPQILAAMLTVASKKGVYFVLMLIVLAFGIRGLWRMKTPLDRLAVLASGMFLGYNAFLLFTYISAFGKFDALRAASYWRYNIHAGLFANVFLVFGLAMLWQKRDLSSLWGKRLGVAAIAILLIAPLVFAKKLRFDHEGRKPHYQSVARDLKELIPVGKRYFIVDPDGNGEVGVITKYRFGDPAAYGGVLSAFHPVTVKSLNNSLDQSKPDFVLVHSTFSGVSEFFGIPLSEKNSYLLRNEAGTWREVKSWEDKTRN